MKRAILSLLCGLALAASAFAQTPNPPGEGGRITHNSGTDYYFSWQSRVGRFYFVQFSEDLVQWTFIPGAYTEGLNEILGFAFSASGPDRVFVRLRYLETYVGDPLTQDPDGDKVSTFDEIWDGNDPFATSDVDGDGLPGDWEKHFGLNPRNSSDGSADGDGDGLSNLGAMPFGN